MAEGSGDFNATTEEIRAAALRVSDRHMPNYAMAVVRLYNVVGNLSSAWEGTDSDAFKKVLDEKRPAIAHIIEVFGQYTKFMREAAQRMDDTESGNTGATSRL